MPRRASVELVRREELAPERRVQAASNREASCPPPSAPGRELKNKQGAADHEGLGKGACPCMQV